MHSHGSNARLRRYPPGFVVRHPLRTARNLVGNHPSPLADRWLSGLRGVEIGGSAHNDFFLDTVNVDYTREPPTARNQLRHAGRVMPVDFIATAEALPFEDESYDFVLASHVIEHVPDPVGALKEWSRVARCHVFLVIPQRGNEFDRDRPLTSADELLERHRRGFTAAEDRHWSVWTAASFAALCERLGIPVLELQDPDDKRGNGFAAVLDASAARQLSLSGRPRRGA